MDDMQVFSLLTPKDADDCFELSDTAANDLSVSYLAMKLSTHQNEQAKLEKLLRQMPTDRRTIAYRQDIYRDLKSNPELAENLYKILDAMQFFIQDKRPADYEKSTIWELVNRLRGLQNYIESVTKMQELLKGREFQSEGMRNFAAHIADIYENSGFDALTEDLKVLSEGVDQVRSMTLGVNLDQNLQPIRVGIVSFNRFVFDDKGIVKRFLTYHSQKLLTKDDIPPFEMMTHLEKYERVPTGLMNNLTGIVEQMLPSVTRSLKTELQKYIDLSGEELARCGEELLFYLRCIKLEQKLTEKGMPCCEPEFSNDDTQFCDLYNVKLALREDSGEVVCNDLEFTKDKTILILTGPNRGGKTILTQGIGLAMLLFQHGVFVPCRSGKVRPCDAIFTHFPADENQTVMLGRLGEESARFRNIWEQATENSLLLMNESFATTSHSESLYIAEDVLKCLCCVGIRTCYNTHMHELAEHTERLQSERSVCGAASVLMGRCGSENAFRIRYEKPNGKSYAHEIAQQYGITLEQLSEKLN